MYTLFYRRMGYYHENEIGLKLAFVF